MSFSPKLLPAIFTFVTLAAAAQQPAQPPTDLYQATPSLDLSSVDPKADPCNDFYKFACGNFAANHPIPADQASTSALRNLSNLDTQELNVILQKYAAPSAARTPNEQKIGDYYHACMDIPGIEAAGLKPIQPLLEQINSMTLLSMAATTGRLQRMGVDVLFGFGEGQDFKDASKQIAFIDQGGLGMPEKDFYLRTGAKDEQIRKDYVAHVAKMLTLAGPTPEQARKDADAIMAFETALAKASMGVTERRDPEKIYHLVPVSTISRQFPLGMFTQFQDAVHAPHIEELNDTNPAYIPAMISLVRSTDIATLRAYYRYHLLTTVAAHLPKRFDDENFDFYGKDLTGATEQRAQWKRCSGSVDAALGEALGQVYVQQYFAGDSKARVLEMVKDIEHAMDKDIDSLDWMSPATKVKAKEKLHAVANKIGYPDKWRDYSSLTIKPNDPVANELASNTFENDRQFAKIGKPVDPSEWLMSPPTVNAYYDPSMNNINFPAGILQPNFYDATADDALNYGHIGAVIGHELTHGFDDEGRKFDGKGNLSDWWTKEDIQQFEAKTDCLVNEYNQFSPVDDLHVNGKLTLGENTADNGGLVLAYNAYLEREKQKGVDINQKIDGYTGPQRFYIAFAQNWCTNERPESLRTGIATNPHSPGQFRSNGPIVNQPGFGPAFSCKASAPMVPVRSCRVW